MNGFAGRKHTPEAKAKISAALTGKPHPRRGRQDGWYHPPHIAALAERNRIKWWGECIGDRFNVPTGWGDVVKLYDIRMLATEKRDLMPQGANDHWPILEGIEPFKFEIIPWPSADHAVRRFLDLYGKIRP